MHNRVVGMRHSCQTRARSFFLVSVVSASAGEAPAAVHASRAFGVAGERGDAGSAAGVAGLAGGGTALPFPGASFLIFFAATCSTSILA